MRVLGLDLGAKRIGLAISDAEGSIAFPMETLQHESRAQVFAALREVIREREVQRVVVGLPLHMDGRAGPEAEAAKKFARDLEKATGLRVDIIDERWTTVEAERSLRATGRKGRKRRAVVDSVAASILLRTYLELHGDGDDSSCAGGEDE
jgi:putative Holliday junction resolvase